MGVFSPAAARQCLALGVGGGDGVAAVKLAQRKAGDRLSARVRGC